MKYQFYLTVRFTAKYFYPLNQPHRALNALMLRNETSQVSVADEKTSEVFCVLYNIRKRFYETSEVYGADE